MKSLIVAPAWIGDMVMAHTLVQLLQQAHPSMEIHVVAPSATAPLAERMPGVAGVHELGVGHGELGLRRRWRLASSLRGRGFQTAYVLPNSFKSALIPFWAGVPVRVGWHGEARYWLLNDRRRPDPKRYPRMIDRFMGLGLPRNTALPQTGNNDTAKFSKPTRLSHQLASQRRGDAEPRSAGRLEREPDESAWERTTHPPKLLVNQDNLRRALNALGLHRNRPVTALCPGAEYGAAKRWPPEHFAAVARARLQQGDSVWVLGSAADTEPARRIADAAPGVNNLAGRTSLLDAVDLLSVTDYVVTNDSGLMHVACALDRNVVAVFGSTSPAFTPPLNPRATVVENDLDCRPCLQRECPLSHLNCLREIGPERILSAIKH